MRERELDEPVTILQHYLLDAVARANLLCFSTDDDHEGVALSESALGDGLGGVDAARPHAQLAHEGQVEEHRRGEREHRPPWQCAVKHTVHQNPVVGRNAMRVNSEDDGLLGRPRAQRVVDVQAQREEAPECVVAPLALGKLAPRRRLTLHLRLVHDLGPHEPRDDAGTKRRPRVAREAEENRREEADRHDQIPIHSQRRRVRYRQRCR